MENDKYLNTTIRMATADDAAAIAAIYAHYVQNTTVSFEYEVPSVREMSRRITETLNKYPWLVCVHHEQRLGGQESILGYACAHTFFTRAAYQWDVELTIYMDQHHTGSGIGSLLYRTLFAILKEQNIQNVYSLVTVPNPSSERLHQKFGFQSCGIWSQTGYKFEQWLDVQVYSKSLSEHICPPPPFRPLQTIDAQRIQELLMCR